MATKARRAELSQAQRYVHKTVFLFSVKANKTVVYKSPQELFLYHLLYSKTDLAREQIVVMLRKFDCQDEEMTTPIILKLLNAMSLVGLFDIADITANTSRCRQRAEGRDELHRQLERADTVRILVPDEALEDPPAAVHEGVRLAGPAKSA